MRFNYLKTSLKTAVLATTVLLLGVGLAVGQVGLTAAPTTLVTPDGAAVPMWGYRCDTAVAGAIYPARFAARIQPAEALRYE